MAVVRFRVVTSVKPQAVIDVLTDFSDRRPELYRNIDRTHFRVHDRGQDWADVTEGNILAWERNRYQWNPAAGTVTVETIESNSWAVGSRWEYRVQPVAAGGAQIDVTVVRTPRTLRGRLIALALPMVGIRVLRADLENVLARVGGERSSA